MTTALKNIISQDRLSEKKLPPRVLARIRDQQESSEILIGWIQFVVVSAWAVLYTLAPKTFSEEADFAPVPWALAVYLAFTLIRMFLAHRKQLPNWMLYLSVFFDIAILMGLIWSFHIQYQQPPSFYLKAPTLLYVFIFIALRALHFEARFVIATGVAAALGWLFMLGYSIHMYNPTGHITKDYVNYMTSNNVLLGAEFDKIISILMVTGILGVALVRAKELLIRSVVESTAAQDLSRFVPSQIAAQVKTAEQEVSAGQGEVREASILFTDLEGFSTLSEKIEPTEIIDVLNEYFSVIAKPIVDNGGVINQFQGDAILASFNLPEADDEHASKAVKAAIEIQRALKDHIFSSGLRLRSRVGINSGEVVGGLVGTSDRLNYTVHGDDVNLAARLEQLNKEYETRILVSERTMGLAKPGGFEFKKMGEVTARGRHTPTVVYTVTYD